MDSNPKIFDYRSTLCSYDKSLILSDVDVKLSRQERSPTRAFLCVFMRTIEWVQATRHVKIIDQRQLPSKLTYLECTTAEEMAEAIRTMAIRGAPALGVAAAFGLALAAQEATGCASQEVVRRLKLAGDLLANSRPTAVNLARGVRHCLCLLDQPGFSTKRAAELFLEAAENMADEDVRINQRLAENGARLIADGDTILHHCNTGALAGVDWGTALGAIRYAHEQGKKVHVLVDETRPLLQGARLTAWECGQYGIPYEIITDNMAGYFLRRGEVNKVFFGADRVAANGDVANKVGTYMLSLAAHESAVPVVCVFPTSTLDTDTPDGEHIQIEERDQTEVLDIQFRGQRVTPTGAQARNPAFDVTPRKLISYYVTENGLINPPFSQK